MTETLTREHPLWLILEHQGRSLAWLARRTEYTPEYIRHIKAGDHPVTPKFRAACARAIDIPEGVLFLSSDCLAVTTDEQDSGKDHAPEPTPEPNGTGREVANSSETLTVEVGR